MLTLGLAPNIVSSNAQRNVIPTLNQCAAGIAAARELIKSQKSEDLALAYQAVSAYLPTLRAIMQESSQHRKTAANLAAQCARLRSAIGRIGWHSENLKQAEIYAQQAVEYAQESGDLALLISAILSQAWAYYDDRRCAEGVAVIARTIPLLKQNDVPRSLAARVLSTQAVLQARNGQTSSSSESLRKAHSVVNKLTDDYYAFTDTVIIEMTGNEGMAHYHAGNYDRALDTFTQLIDDSSLASKKLLSGKGRVEMLNFMALSELKSPKRDMDKTISFWQTDSKEPRPSKANNASMRA